MEEFKTPSFLLGHSTNENHEKMKAILPADIDISEGGHAWNLTRPSALIAAELFEFILPEVIRLILPEYSYGAFLDGHAKGRNMTRRAATAANGHITITGAVNTTIPAGSLFSTASINDEPSVDYETLEAATIPESGTVTVPVQCTETGVIGNTTTNTIILCASKITGISSVTNEEAVTGGTEKESDESLIERILLYDQSQGESFVGSPSDYKRWAMSVAGVGAATVIPAQDDSGLVTIILTDSNGQPATDQLCEKVYNYIMSPDDQGNRLAPVNAFLSVVPPTTMKIAIKAIVELDSEATIEAAKTSFITQLSAYLPEAMDDKEIKYTKVYAKLSEAAGVNDFRDLQIGVKGSAFGTDNIPITTSSLPEISAEDIAFTSGTV